MNLKTTIILIALVAAVGFGLFSKTLFTKDEAAGPTERFLNQDLKNSEAIKRIEIGKDAVVLEQTAPGEWSLPGKWPVRPMEVKELVQSLTSLHTRFAPITIGEKADLKEYGLDHPLVVKVVVDGKEHSLAFGEKQSAGNRFSRETFARLDDQKEIVQLAPGLVAALDRPKEYYQLPRLFPHERLASDNDPAKKNDQLEARAISIKSPEGTIELAKKDDAWEITAPMKDHVDPDKLKTLLAAFPEIWAEKFVDKGNKTWEDFGLKEPATVLSVTKPSGSTIKLLIGAEAETKLKKIPRPAPPPQQFMPPPKQEFDTVPEVYRFAKLEDNDQVFEIKADNLKNISLGLKDLRDANIARFRTEDVKRLEIHPSEPEALATGAKSLEPLVFIKDKDRWRMEKPKAGDAENGPISELLDKLSALQARDNDILDKADEKTLGLEKPAAQIKITVEEEKGPKDKKTKTTRTLVYDLGTKEKEKDKLYIKVEGWPRVNAVDDAVLKLVRRPELVYRGRKVLDLAEADLGKLEIQRGQDSYTFSQDKGTWKLTAPVEADVDSSKVARLAGELSKLEAVEFITDNPKADDLDKVYGLAKPALTATLFRVDPIKADPPKTDPAKPEPQKVESTKPKHVLALGKARGDKEYYARLENGPVFVVRKNLYSDLDRDSLVYCPLDIHKGLKDKIKELAIKKDGQEYRLVKDDKTWKLRGPFDAAALAEIADPIAQDFADLRATRYVAHAAKDLKEYGLDQPYLTIRLVSEGNEPDYQIQIGKPAPRDDKGNDKSKDKDADKDTDKDKLKEKDTGRYAKLANGSAVFLLSDKVVSLFDKSPLDFLDKKMLALDAKNIQKVQSAGKVPFALQKKNDAWEVVDSPAPPFTAEEDAAQNLLLPLSNLRAERIAAYGPKIDWAAFGLDMPAQTLTITVAGDKDKTTTYQFALGKEVDKGLRFARLDKQDEVAVLSADAVAALTGSYLDFVSHAVLKFDLDTVTALTRQMSGSDMELVKKEDAWRFVKPSDKAADDLTVSGILDKLFRLRAERIAAYPAKDLATFGLDNPAAVVTVKLTKSDGGTEEHVIKIGKLVDDKKEERFALVDKGEAVVVLAPELSRRLVAPVLFYADRNLAGFGNVDKVVLERPGRKLTFTHGDAGWSLTDPVKAEAESADLEELAKSLLRPRAEEIVALKDADLKTYGLDRPETQWHFYGGDKEVMNLLVGNPDKEGRRYAMLAGGDQVFTLNAKLSSRLVDEYRNRKPWPALDAVQVEKLTYTGPASFVLQKKGADWSLSTSPNAKINAKQVTDTLDALASLKAVRYVADANADLKLYGLDPSVWTIEIETPTGKRTLLVGRPEDDSHRVYATVPGSNAVFIIGEAEAQRILRSFVGLEPKG